MLGRRSFLAGLGGVAGCATHEAHGNHIVEAYATQAGQPAFDSLGGAGSPFARSFVEALSSRPPTAGALLDLSRSRTLTLTANRQRPDWSGADANFPIRLGGTAGPALVLVFTDYVGSSAWQPLNGAEHDAGAIADSLTGAGFDVTFALNQAGDEVRQTLADFALASREAEQALIYCTGHGVRVGGEQYIIPLDATAEDASILQIAYRWREIAAANRATTQLSIWAGCRDNPLNWPT